MSKPLVTGYNWAPDEGRGLVRDMRVRWALEEVGQPYDVRHLEALLRKLGVIVAAPS